MDSDPTIDDIDRTGDDLIARIREITSHVKGHGNGWGPLLQACEREILRIREVPLALRETEIAEEDVETMLRVACDKDAKSGRYRGGAR